MEISKAKEIIDYYSADKLDSDPAMKEVFVQLSNWLGCLDEIRTMHKDYAKFVSYEFNTAEYFEDMCRLLDKYKVV